MYTIFLNKVASKIGYRNSKKHGESKQVRVDKHAVWLSGTKLPMTVGCSENNTDQVRTYFAKHKYIEMQTLSSS